MKIPTQQEIEMVKPLVIIHNEEVIEKALEGFKSSVCQCDTLTQTQMQCLVECRNFNEIQEYLKQEIQKKYNLELDWLYSLLPGRQVR
jgi:hypothetical protein